LHRCERPAAGDGRELHDAKVLPALCPRFRCADRSRGLGQRGNIARGFQSQSVAIHPVVRQKQPAGQSFLDGVKLVDHVFAVVTVGGNPARGVDDLPPQTVCTFFDNSPREREPDRCGVCQLAPTYALCPEPYPPSADFVASAALQRKAERVRPRRPRPRSQQAGRRPEIDWPSRGRPVSITSGTVRYVGEQTPAGLSAH